MKFKSKIDRWYMVIHWGCIGLIIIASGLLWLDPATSILSKVLFSLLMGGVCWLMIDIYTNTHYTVADGMLYIQAGRFKWRIKLSKVEWVRPSRNLFSSPALSLDRLAIKQTTSNIPIIISPEDKADFLKSLVEAEAGLVYRDDQVLRIGEG